MQSSDSDSAMVPAENRAKRRKMGGMPPVQFKSRTSPKSVFKLIQVLSDDQKKAVEEIGFGSILKMGISQCPLQISRYLLKNYDIKHRSIVLENGEAIKLTEEDVQSVFNLPRGPVEIVESVGIDKSDTAYTAFLRDWRAAWGIPVAGGGPTTGQMLKRLSEEKTGEDNFKRDFTVFFVSLVLWGTKNQKCRFKILKSLIDVNNIKNLNWCEYTLKALDSTVQHWKTNEKCHFDGPLAFLLLSYLDRCEYRVRRPSEQRFPVICCWDDNKVDQRIKWECNGGGFGMGRAVPRAARRSQTESDHNAQVALDNVPPRSSSTIRVFGPGF